MEITMETLRELCNANHIKWTAHVLARLQEREIQPSDIRSCILTGEIIEQYPNDYPFPSCLVSGETTTQNPLHAVLGVGEGYAWLVTAYYPDRDRWEQNYTVRRKEL